MTEAEKSPLFNALFWRYISWSLKRHFCSVSVEIPPYDRTLPRLYIANHNTWWDGFFIFAINQLLLRDDIHLMMGEEQFRRFPFFRKLGVFSVQADRFGDVRASFEYSIRLLKRSPRSSLWIFPSGEMMPYGAPARYKDGFARIAALAQPLLVIPVAMKIEYTQSQHPEVFILGGEQLVCTGRPAEEIFAVATQSLDRTLQQLHDRIAGNDTAPFRTLLKGRSSVSDRYARLRGRG